MSILNKQNMTDLPRHFGRKTYSPSSPDECIFVDSSIKNLNAAQSIGIDTVLFDRDHEVYSGNIVNSFAELEQILKND